MEGTFINAQTFVKIMGNVSYYRAPMSYSWATVLNNYIYAFISVYIGLLQCILCFVLEVKVVLGSLIRIQTNIRKNIGILFRSEEILQLVKSINPGQIGFAIQFVYILVENFLLLKHDVPYDSIISPFALSLFETSQFICCNSSLLRYQWDQRDTRSSP